MLSAKKKKQLGQGMTEYVIIVALIAVSSIIVVSLFGTTLRSQFAGIAQELSGQDSTTAVTNAQDAANDATTDADVEYDMGDYKQNQGTLANK